MNEIETLSRDEDRQSRKHDERVPQLYVLLECDRPLSGSSRHLLDGIDRVQIGRAAQRISSRAGGTLAITVPDARMSSPHARLVKRDGRWIAEDEGSKNGLVVDGEKRARITLSDGMVLELGHTLLLYREELVGATGQTNPPLDVPDLDMAQLASIAPGLETFVPNLARTFADLGAVARTSAAILVQGETGTGKELTARAAHGMAKRTGPFVAVNCGALPDTLVESELYGHRRGAFSGADQDRPGLVRSADRGTLFLDEIADLPLSSQAALLRVLQEREVTPLGATQPIPVDLHVVAASHHDLEARVARNEFRRDLYARLAAFTVRLPPLRERREDFGLLIAAILPKLASPDLRISCAAARALLDHDWPLNVRELESCLMVAGALARGGAIKLEHLPASVVDSQPIAPTATLSPEDQAKREELVGLLRQHQGNVSAIARATGKARAQVHRWLRRFQLDPASFR